MYIYHKRKELGMELRTFSPFLKGFQLSEIVSDTRVDL